MIARKYWQLHAVSLTGWDMLWHHSQTMTYLWSFCAWIKIRFPAVGSVMATACVLMEACSWPGIASLLFECLKRRAEEGIDHGLGDWSWSKVSRMLWVVEAWRGACVELLWVSRVLSALKQCSACSCCLSVDFFLLRRILRSLLVIK